MRALFEELKNAPDGLAARDAIAAVRNKVTLSPEEEGTFEVSASEKFPKVMRFATITVTKAGWMQKQDGIWAITPDGATALAAYPDPEKLWQQARALRAR